jgi:hypothetical protein
MLSGDVNIATEFRERRADMTVRTRDARDHMTGAAFEQRQYIATALRISSDDLRFITLMMRARRKR